MRRPTAQQSAALAELATILRTHEDNVSARLLASRSPRSALAAAGLAPTLSIKLTEAAAMVATVAVT